MIRLKAPWEIAMMQASGGRLAEVVAILEHAIRPGLTGLELDALAEEEIHRRNGVPSFKGYRAGGNRAFPATLCISRNEEVVHGIPDDKPFRPGEVVSIDVGLQYGGYHADTAFTVAVGEIPARVQELLDATRESLYEGIARAVPGNRTGDIGHAVESHVAPRGFSVIRDYVGHGVGRDLHEEPTVPNFGQPHTGVLLKPGLCIAIEPMVSMGSHLTQVARNGWTVTTRDGSITAHFEHSIAITESGPLILTTL
ncbi:MAG: type I methionyl aminopeptidase [Deltaproteobacteria bacterium]|nr:type I methionyl aminopeptidase [Deltaproteobacteria bacterium]